MSDEPYLPVHEYLGHLASSYVISAAFALPNGRAELVALFAQHWQNEPVVQEAIDWLDGFADFVSFEAALFLRDALALDVVPPSADVSQAAEHGTPVDIPALSVVGPLGEFNGWDQEEFDELLDVLNAWKADFIRKHA